MFAEELAQEFMQQRKVLRAGFQVLMTVANSPQRRVGIFGSCMQSLAMRKWHNLICITLYALQALLSAPQQFSSSALHVAKRLDLNTCSSACCIKAMRLAGQCCQGRQSCLQITPGLPGAAIHYFTLHVQVTELPAKAVKAQADCMQGVAVLSKRVSWQT